MDVRDPPPGRCSDTTVYIADVTGFGILVYNLRTNRSWHTQNKLFYPYPYYGTHTVAGETFDLMDGVFGLAVSPLTFGKHETYQTKRKIYTQNTGIHF